MDSTTERPSPAREKAAAIRHVSPTRQPISRHAPPARPRSAGWTMIVLFAWLAGAAALAGGLYVYFGWP